jgi:hypothetical protein
LEAQRSDRKTQIHAAQATGALRQCLSRVRLMSETETSSREASGLTGAAQVLFDATKLSRFAAGRKAKRANLAIRPSAISVSD